MKHRRNREFRNKTGNLERRTFKANVRAAKGNDGKPRIEGYAAVVGEVTDLGWFKEEIAPGAFTRTLRENADVRCLFNHDANFILGRTKSNTLSLSQDDKGLRYDCQPPDTPQANSVVTSIERGDVDGSSFGFVVQKQEWIEEKDDKGEMITTRRILDVDLFDVSPVVFPAYAGTSCDVRALWPEGIPQEVRTHAGHKLKGALHRDMNECECECPECQDGNCAECSMEGCDDEYCAAHGCPMQDDRSRARRAEIRRGKRKTKKVGGKNLTSDKFAFVGDENDTSTWKLPIHDKNHVRNALARFNQTEGIPEDQKEKVWKKIVAAAKKFGIQVSDDDDRARCVRAKDPDGDGDDDQPLIDCLENVLADAREFVEVTEDALEEVNAGDEEKPMLEEFLTEARELQGLLKDAIEEAEQELAEPEPEMDQDRERMRMRLELAKRD